MASHALQPTLEEQPPCTEPIADSMCQCGQARARYCVRHKRNYSHMHATAGHNVPRAMRFTGPCSHITMAHGKRTAMPRQVKRAAIYLRVSTRGKDQTTENQRLALAEEATRRGWIVAREYEDSGISGAKGRDKRHGLDAMLHDAARGKFDVVMVWALDRLGRSLISLIDTAQELEAASVDLYVMQQAIDTTSPAGRMFFHIVGAFAEYERDIMRERIMAGLERARANGKRFGRPPTNEATTAAVLAGLSSGKSIRAIMAETGVSYGGIRGIRSRVAPVSTAPDQTAPD